MPRDDCRRFIAAVYADEARKPSEQEAAMLGGRLVGAFGTVKVDDRDAYVEAIIRTLAAFPLSICEQAVDPVNGYPGKHRFAPNSPADLIAYMKGVQATRHGLMAKAQWCLKEAEKRERARQEEANLPTPERRKEMAEQLRGILKPKSMSNDPEIPVPPVTQNGASAATDPGPYLD